MTQSENPLFLRFKGGVYNFVGPPPHRPHPQPQTHRVSAYRPAPMMGSSGTIKQACSAVARSA